MKTAFISGITGQDGSYLTELLLSKNYIVHGIVRRSSMTQRPRLDHLLLDSNIYGSKLFLHYADLDDVTSIRRLLYRVKPDEFYHLAGQSHVGASFEIPESTCEFTAMGTLRLLELIRDMDPAPKFLNVGSSEIFGRPTEIPQNELTPLNPVSPYGVAKAFTVQMVRVYRKSFQMFCCNAICYNHESPRRGLSFVTKKIANAVARIHLGQENRLMLGNLDSQRDWGFAGDYVYAMWLLLQHETPIDCVIASGKTTSLQELLSIAFETVGLDWRKFVQIDSRLIRPSEPSGLVGDSSLAKKVLNWEPKVSLVELVKEMVFHEINLLQSQASSTHS